MKSFIGKIIYGAIFLAFLPLGLVIWSNALSAVMGDMPTIESSIIGSLLILMGSAILISGWFAIIWYGKGMPMNAFPPQKLVTNGIYKFLSHPIYFGFTILVAGFSVFTGSSAGLWIITPVVILSSIALVYGYELIDFKKRFDSSNWLPLIRYPSRTMQPPTLSERLSAYLLVLIPWLILYEAIIIIGPFPDAVNTYFDFERSLPVLEWTEFFYASAYLFVPLAPLVAKTKHDLRSFMIMGLLATGIGVLIFFLLPFKATPRPFTPTTLLGEILTMERSLDGAAGAFPAFHVIWALLSAWLYTKSFKKPFIWYSLATTISLSCITTGMHSIFDVIGAVIVFFLVSRYILIWKNLLAVSEWMANSWKEWRFGKLRFINHGLYVGIGSFIGFLITVYLAGDSQFWFVIIICVSSLIGAGIWGQALEGSSKLSRPFGFYGGLFGGSIALFVIGTMGADEMRIAAAFSVAIPFIQSIGRLRCFVQGCCHGRECSKEKGIVVFQERSRVHYVANLSNRYIYPTQLYSILYNILLGFILIRMWTLSVQMPFIIGVYLIVGSLGRFVEEAYRGEPQTPDPGGLSVYQWLALAGVVAGAMIMTLAGQPSPTDSGLIDWYKMLWAAIIGVTVCFAMGVDFPESDKRFSRLT